MSTLSTTSPWTSEKTASKTSRLRAFASAVIREIRVRRAIRDVGSLDDAALRDIGLDRGGIDDVVRHGRL